MLTSVNDLLRVKGKDIWSVTPETSAQDALALLAEKDIGALIVLDGDKIAGIVSERDFVRQIAKTSACDLESKVSKYMTRNVFTIDAAQTIEDCMNLMTENRIRHLPALEDGKLAGMISIGDVVKAIIDSQEFTIEQLSKYISGDYSG